MGLHGEGLLRPSSRDVGAGGGAPARRQARWRGGIGRRRRTGSPVHGEGGTAAVLREGGFAWPGGRRWAARKLGDDSAGGAQGDDDHRRRSAWAARSGGARALGGVRAQGGANQRLCSPVERAPVDALGGGQRVVGRLDWRGEADSGLVPAAAGWLTAASVRARRRRSGDGR
jgi:hypothetical protein